MRTAFLWAITQRVVVIAYRRFGTTCRSQLQGSTLKDILSWPLKMEPIYCAETSVRNCRYSLRHNSEERSSRILRGGSLNSSNICHLAISFQTRSLVDKWLIILILILRRSRTGTVWFYTSTRNKRAARPKLYTESLTRDLKRMYSRLTLVRISINL